MWRYNDGVISGLIVSLNLLGVFTDPYFVTIALAERELYCFTKVTWSYNSDAIVKLKVSMYLIDVSYLFNLKFKLAC